MPAPSLEDLQRAGRNLFASLQMVPRTQLVTTGVSDNVALCQALYEHTTACTQRRAPFRSLRKKCRIQPRPRFQSVSSSELSPTHASLRSNVRSWLL